MIGPPPPGRGSGLGGTAPGNAGLGNIGLGSSGANAGGPGGSSEEGHGGMGAAEGGAGSLTGIRTLRISRGAGVEIGDGCAVDSGRVNSSVKLPREPGSGVWGLGSGIRELGSGIGEDRTGAEAEGGSNSFVNSPVAGGGGESWLGSGAAESAGRV